LTIAEHPAIVAATRMSLEPEAAAVERRPPSI
jgi:hypothetical protein